MRKTEAEMIWKERYGNKKLVKDFHGNYMSFEGYGNPNYVCKVNGKKIYSGWNIHHILPKSKGGPNDKGNLECTNIITNQRIADKTTYWLDDKKYQVRKKCNAYVISKLVY